MANWTYRCYDDGKSPTLWHRWFSKNENCQGAHDSTFRILEQQESWIGPNWKRLGPGIGEVKVTAGNVEWRIVGFIRGTQEFVVVAIGYHKQRVYTPRNLLDDARKLANACKKDITLAPVCARPL